MRHLEHTRQPVASDASRLLTVCPEGGEIKEVLALPGSGMLYTWEPFSRLRTLRAPSKTARPPLLKWTPVPVEEGR